MILKPTAEATWSGPLWEGSGKIRTKSLVLNDTSYSFVARTTENKVYQTSPEELIAAAHSSCFNMHLSLLATQRGYTIYSLKTTATVKLKHVYDDLVIEEIDLSVTANIPTMSVEELIELADITKFQCPISKALAVVPIILSEIKLEETLV